MILRGHVLDRLAELLAASVHCCITSPPYWGLRNYKTPPQTWPDGWTGHHGLEPTLEAWVQHTVDWCRAVRRVLRADGTLWLNLGDSYGSRPDGSHGGWNGDSYNGGQNPQRTMMGGNSKGQGGDRLLQPYRVALALQADGWTCRDVIVWCKGVSFRPEWSGSVMPESVHGWEWRRCRVKVAASTVGHKGDPGATGNRTWCATNGQGGKDPKVGDNAVWSDCPGCAKCAPHGGLVLRRGRWRPTSAYEVVLLMTGTGVYFADAEAVREKADPRTLQFNPRYAKLAQNGPYQAPNPRGMDDPLGNPGIQRMEYLPTTRNPRNVWAIGTEPFRGRHFATFPRKLIEPMIRVATSEKGVCPACGAPWARVVEKETLRRPRPADRTERHLQGEGVNSCGNTVAGTKTVTLSWRATCACAHAGVVPATVLDPFLGSGTSAIAAEKLGRKWIGIELLDRYADIAQRRIERKRNLWMVPQ